MAAPPGGGSGGENARDIHNFTHSLRSCNTCAMLKLALLRLRTARALAGQVREATDRADRLEIAVRRCITRQDELSADLLRLSERLSKTEGRAAGRPPRAPQQVSLADIPPGDKPALRRALGLVASSPKE